MRMLRATVLLTILVMGASACASTGGSGSSRNFNEITRAELDQVENRVSNLYEAIQRLRPRWLTVRGGDRSFGTPTEIVVYQEQSYLGDLGSLRSLDPSFPHSLSYLDAAQATAQLPGLGSRSVGGAIVIHTRPTR